MRISDWSSDVCSSDLIKAAEPVVDRRNQFLHRFGIAYVRGLRQNLRSSRLVYGGLRRLELFLVAAADCHACAQSHRKEGGGLAHAASTAGDEDSLSGQQIVAAHRLAAGEIVQIGRATV